MESALEVLSRAATMVQDNANDTKLSNKELPTTKWRRDRRIRTSSEYHAQTSLQLANCLRLAAAEQQLNGGVGGGATDNGPLDMTLTTKPRTPPPPYREPLPGSTYAAISARPSVITQAPKRDFVGNKIEKSISMCDPVIDEHFRRSLGDDYMILFSKNKPNENNKENTLKVENLKKEKVAVDPIEIERNENSMDNDVDDEDVIDGHSDADSEFSDEEMKIDEMKENNHTKLIVSPKLETSSLSGGTSPSLSPNQQISTSPIIPSTTTTTTFPNQSIELSVDDHFAKALGDTWKKIQEENNKQQKFITKNNVSLSSNSSNSNSSSSNSNLKKDTLRTQCVLSTK